MDKMLEKLDNNISQMNYPLISIIICTYNGERFLKEQIQSIVEQTYPNLEIIISDDASTDKTKAILSEYKKFSNIQLVFNNTNIGFVKNFEFAARLANARYIAFSDQDDVWLPRKIEKLYHAIGNHSLVYSDSTLINQDGQSLNKKLSDFKHMKNINDSRGFIFSNVISGHTIMINKELLKYALPIPESYYHDWWFGVQAANLKGIIYLNEVSTLYRQHRATVTKTIVERKRGSRKFSKRFQHYLRELKWVELIKNSELEKHKPFYNQLYNLLLLKNKKVFVWSLFCFLLRNEKVFFQFSKKGFFSKIIEIRKMARGERL